MTINKHDKEINKNMPALALPSCPDSRVGGMTSLSFSDERDCDTC